ncbi:hypothetical protein J2W51_000119 [Tardiphaga robiniae]|uniref:hypothetical protein n=1 Tax=Tardiphaga robiniae TaxID=943830 RepID=UPI0028573CC5|nr:hypothetical protein [Tardiphaga robiniae]MDR6657577.1 hypothetical protein [Tardiphaga robiniae]
MASSVAVSAEADDLKTKCDVLREKRLQDARSNQTPTKSADPESVLECEVMEDYRNPYARGTLVVIWLTTIKSEADLHFMSAGVLPTDRERLDRAQDLYQTVGSFACDRDQSLFTDRPVDLKALNYLCREARYRLFLIKSRIGFWGITRLQTPSIPVVHLRRMRDLMTDLRRLHSDILSNVDRSDDLRTEQNRDSIRTLDVAADLRRQRAEIERRGVELRESRREQGRYDRIFQSLREEWETAQTAFEEADQRHSRAMNVLESSILNGIAQWTGIPLPVPGGAGGGGFEIAALGDMVGVAGQSPAFLRSVSEFGRDSKAIMDAVQAARKAGAAVEEVRQRYEQGRRVIGAARAIVDTIRDPSGDRLIRLGQIALSEFEAQCRTTKDAPCGDFEKARKRVGELRESVKNELGGARDRLGVVIDFAGRSDAAGGYVREALRQHIVKALVSAARLEGQTDAVGDKVSQLGREVATFVRSSLAEHADDVEGFYNQMMAALARELQVIDNAASEYPLVASLLRGELKGTLELSPAILIELAGHEVDADERNKLLETLRLACKSSLRLPGAAAPVVSQVGPWSRERIDEVAACLAPSSRKPGIEVIFDFNVATGKRLILSLQVCQTVAARLPSRPPVRRGCEPWKRELNLSSVQLLQDLRKQYLSRLNVGGHAGREKFLTQVEQVITEFFNDIARRSMPVEVLEKSVDRLLDALPVPALQRQVGDALGRIKRQGDRVLAQAGSRLDRPFNNSEANAFFDRLLGPSAGVAPQPGAAAASPVGQPKAGDPASCNPKAPSEHCRTQLLDLLTDREIGLRAALQARGGRKAPAGATGYSAPANADQPPAGDSDALALQVAAGALNAAFPGAGVALQAFKAFMDSESALNDMDAAGRRQKSALEREGRLMELAVKGETAQELALIELDLARSLNELRREQLGRFEEVQRLASERGDIARARVRARLPLFFLLTERLREEFDLMDLAVRRWGGVTGSASGAIVELILDDPQNLRYVTDTSINLEDWFDRSTMGSRTDVDQTLINWEQLARMAEDACIRLGCDLGTVETSEVRQSIPIDIRDMMSRKDQIAYDDWSRFWKECAEKGFSLEFPNDELPALSDPVRKCTGTKQQERWFSVVLRPTDRQLVLRTGDYNVRTIMVRAGFGPPRGPIGVGEQFDVAHGFVLRHPGPSRIRNRDGSVWTDVLLPYSPSGFDRPIPFDLAQLNQRWNQPIAPQRRGLEGYGLDTEWLALIDANTLFVHQHRTVYVRFAYQVMNNANLLTESQAVARLARIESRPSIEPYHYSLRATRYSDGRAVGVTRTPIDRAALESFGRFAAEAADRKIPDSSTTSSIAGLPSAERIACERGAGMSIGNEQDGYQCVPMSWSAFRAAFGSAEGGVVTLAPPANARPGPNRVDIALVRSCKAEGELTSDIIEESLATAGNPESEAAAAAVLYRSDLIETGFALPAPSDSLAFNSNRRRGDPAAIRENAKCEARRRLNAAIIVPSSLGKPEPLRCGPPVQRTPSSACAIGPEEGPNSARLPSERSSASEILLSFQR